MQENIRLAAMLQLRNTLMEIYPGTPLPPLRKAALRIDDAAAADGAGDNVDDNGSGAAALPDPDGRAADRQPGAAGQAASDGGKRGGLWGNMQKV